MKIIPVDCNYVAPEFATSYLLVEEFEGKSKGFFIECNTNHAIPYLLKAAHEAGLTSDDIDGLCITHVHLDHAGGAGLFLQEFKNSKLYAHPRAARHAIDPSKLIASATEVYGEAFMQKLYGNILPCPSERVTVLENEESIHWRTCELKTRHTRGHANHHLCVIEPSTKTLFSGDSFGVSYPKLNRQIGVLVLASTSPTDFDGPAAIETVEWIRDQDLNRVALTHYAFLEKSEIQDGSVQLIDQLRFSIDLLKAIKQENLSAEQTSARLQSWILNYYSSRNQKIDSEQMKYLKIDIDVNSQGLVFAAAKPAKH